MNKITPFLWFDNQAEQAVQLYSSVFKNCRVIGTQRSGGPGPTGSVMSINFELDGQEFIALNGGPHFTFNEAVSFFVRCADQREVDELWDKLTADGGAPSRCGWLKDRFGISWQIVPTVLLDLLQHSDPAISRRVMQAMLQMTKLDIAGLQRAAAA